MSEAVAARIEAPQGGGGGGGGGGGQSDQSMRQMGHFYQVMYHSSDVLRAPHVKSVADFLRYLFQDRKLQPSTIVGYRSAIADSLEICPSMLVRMKISLVSWIASTETDPKAGGEPPSWNLSLVFAPADKVHFEPIKGLLEAFDLQDSFPLGPGFGQA